ncbi:MAG TPA: tRNA pseudouridine(13) synthase TruD [Dokdonella sp.]|uniref:tRNA pseudouridine(13) synthase TruD n=1 Tax=Dokdonella sp. TaxID=2291710 RepID=UPI002D7FECC0|nr:tRNA pseudouridine(13) synthase TruD [Dokdonella sp.]HET9032979.1 tRNA pseudouridine(13) synthase TruD [Dokdonella sp.]
MIDLPFAHGGPPLHGQMRAAVDDFEVDEILGFNADGKGEHAFLRIEKRNANTEWVAQQLARAAGVAPMSVGYSGLKDRHAVTRQTFSVHLPGRADPDWQALEIEGVNIIEASRHSKKIKRGVHKGNRFRIRLSGLEGDRGVADRRMNEIARDGVPNYFGEQRFGRNGDNLRSAQALFAGARMGRSQRGFALSAARSYLFNRVLAARVDSANWNQALAGEVWMLAGTHSIFGPQVLDDGLRERLASGDIDPTGPLWGQGELRSLDQVAAIETAIAQEESVLAEGLCAHDLRQERRSLRLPVGEFAHEWLADGSLLLSFGLPSGTFATSVVRELCATRGYSQH